MMTTILLILFLIIVGVWLLLRRFKIKYRTFDEFMVYVRRFLRKIKVLRKKRRHDREIKRKGFDNDKKISQS